MSTSFKLSRNHFERKSGTCTKKQLIHHNFINQSSSDQKMNLRDFQGLNRGKVKKSTKNSHSRNISQDNRLKQTAKYMLSSNIDNDIERLENMTFRNQLVRQDLLEIQKRILVLNLNKDVKAIKHNGQFISTHSINPVCQLVEKYNSSN